MPSIPGPVAGGGPSPTPVEVEVHCPSGPARLGPGGAPARARGPQVLPGHRPHWASPAHDAGGGSPLTPVGFLSQPSVPPGAQPPPQPRGPPTRVFVSPHAAGPATRPERRECGQPHPCSPAWNPPQGGGLICYPRHLYQAGVPQEGKTEAAQPPNSHPRWGRRPVAGSAPETRCPATPCSARWLEGTGGETPPSAQSKKLGEGGGRAGAATFSLPQVSGAPTTSPPPVSGAWQLGDMLSWCPTAPLTSTPPQTLARPTLLPLLANLWLMEMSCRKLSPRPNSDADPTPASVCSPKAPSFPRALGGSQGPDLPQPRLCHQSRWGAVPRLLGEAPASPPRSPLSPSLP
ncbi:basic proline-rich protein-like [Myotis myotis]|uniref:basic proline-rich protein-like n=1 Tax=Myotis myotis TaxID=51298 RepID=UPI00174A9E44|nr:basic proline-rich protein-like [Myotis myotis]